MKMTLAVLLILKLYGLSLALVKHHFLVNLPRKWTDARWYCQTYYNDLSSFTTDSEERLFLDDAVNQTSDAWVGLYKTSKDWKWSGGENAARISWDTAMRQPDGDEYEENCGSLFKDTKKVHNSKCSKKQPFFCMTRSALLVRSETWEGALKFCRKHNYDLASLSSWVRVNAAIQGISQAQTQYVWTGLRFLAGEWRWISGDDLDNTVWPVTLQLMCPDRNFQCGALNKQTWTWMPRNCEEKLNFFCQ